MTGNWGIKKIGIVFFCISLFLIPACKSKAPHRLVQSDGALRLYTEQAVIPLFSDASKNKNFLMTLTIDVPDLSEYALKALIQNLLYDDLEPKVYFEQLVGFYESQYFEMRSVLEEYPDLPQGALNWTYLETLETNFPIDPIMMISRSKEYYLGGAHGMRESQYFVIHRKQKKRLQLEDIVKPDGFPLVQEYIQEALRVFSGITPDAPLTKGGFFEDQASIPENFFLTSEGLGFHWNPYQIAPYVMGHIEVLIPYKQLQGMLISLN
ncbi:MAG: RsiV family protein [Treponema sp.]|jgi:hypothetical protein|nr:RsiV family protein [Treponema sp.]